ncbi:hypothetical protein [Ruminococcus flavefaciens]|uniref:SH3b domain-containing protein n=1 Tax=Ruminococcus flavefaciens 007c TaxID=1341157 RepID=W7UWD5_RUMFL|nr:hypothetical protein [Ruminococcus flavefaciens]EWM52657.1 hypothetical protein RF007C_00730 [Ruminococcus flavefaciens 007c]
MANIKKTIAAFAASVAMFGAVAAPTVNNIITANPIVASAAWEGNVDFWVDIKGNTVFRSGPGQNYSVVASIKNRTYGKSVHLTRVAATANGTWYYSQYDHGYVRLDRIIW